MTEVLSSDGPMTKAEWLEARRGGIGASEAAAALGVDPRCSPLELYLRKVGDAPTVEQTEAMRWGLLLEPIVAREYEYRTGNAIVARQEFLRHPTLPLLATLDGRLADGSPVELKTVGQHRAADIGDGDELPETWLLQAHQQMVLADAGRCDFAILIGGQRLEIRTVERSERIVAAMMPGLVDFWRRVETRIPPAPGSGDLKLMASLYPDAEGEIELGADALDLVNAWDAAKAHRKAADAEADHCRLELLRLLGPAAAGELPDGRLLTRRVVRMPEATITRKAYEYVDIRTKNRKGG